MAARGEVWAEELLSWWLGGRWCWYHHVPPFQLLLFCWRVELVCSVVCSVGWVSAQAPERGIYSVGCGCVCWSTRSCSGWSPAAMLGPKVWLKFCFLLERASGNAQKSWLHLKRIQALLKSVSCLVVLRFVIRCNNVMWGECKRGWASPGRCATSGES